MVNLTAVNNKQVSGVSYFCGCKNTNSFGTHQIFLVFFVRLLVYLLQNSVFSGILANGFCGFSSKTLSLESE